MGAKENRRFAFGADQIVDEKTGKEYDCPALKAGYDPNKMETVFQQYDCMLSTTHSFDAGIVDERTAKGAWLHMIRSMSDCEVCFVGSVKEPLEDACRVARKLGWLEELNN